VPGAPAGWYVTGVCRQSCRAQARRGTYGITGRPPAAHRSLDPHKESERDKEETWLNKKQNSRNVFSEYPKLTPTHSKKSWREQESEGNHQLILTLHQHLNEQKKSQVKQSATPHITRKRSDGDVGFSALYLFCFQQYFLKKDEEVVGISLHEFLQTPAAYAQSS